ncbi:tRNA pseudouridine(13) synthase TruD [Marinobacter sp. NP-4(2019)]|uniref:tRNA pseudouridine(13) synthase TruD n=1 Tax=Marinobacter sp. NP-4(2019) TaxID=2488665 RepID=UPI000FC3CCF9|nr:tRNA pseudouridine(13) synthase TruD [Marinobacter sp. NP-4(2019)]AZT83499.1 tRNA pseudouridine(13) synthase TruD [Marinobacter sp. NP-4(2019)]
MSDKTGESGNWTLDWPTSRGHRVARAELKSTPEDFRVFEDLGVPGFPAEGSSEGDVTGGEHLCLLLEKTGDNTEYVARQLALLSGCRHFDVGFCGLKDRHAVTRQWYSIYRPGMEVDDEAFIAQVTGRWPVIAWTRYARKLRRGDHRGNHFEITLRGVTATAGSIDEALAELSKVGAPNYFGPQRFGHGGTNLDRALTIDPSKLNRRARKGGKKRGGGRSGSGSQDSKNVLYFSAARSWLFNEVLGRRVAAGNWRQALEGEPGSGPDSELVVTGPLWGDGGTEAVAEQGAFEREVVAENPGLEALFSVTRMKPERRPLIARPGQLNWQWLAEDILRISFWLAPGQYATTILADIFELQEGAKDPDQ